ncbi:unnamed protein product [Aphanomyces euteiches]|uniref:Uncharacterized protein n=1 Tax=Aphanomyces euteiches TaxID=100861 RepID=A0A6G0XU15_9STRA|nr:hypothetical protein Ae201684_001647 [Aphanomyces euteiches]KAH9075352.1 hypothetical protein Ae201684P_004032 [Aphanomyces euteiches]KAH9105208.1 hypothetical protein AeMF1_018905 [Aphanomyces euteiches]KAH9120018.1 hypothetical protein LEN26_011321 [Aphanomyces euteiches]KAH9132481.1 hypothetical protein AeRB84_021127 [Aphanomyces euteiches]
MEGTTTTTEKRNRAEYFKEYRRKNKAKIAAQQKKYRECNKDKIQEYKERNKEKVAAYHKEYREKYRERNLAQMKLYYERNKAYFKEYYLRNKQGGIIGKAEPQFDIKEEPLDGAHPTVMSISFLLNP